MSTSCCETWCLWWPYNEITLAKVKSLKCSEPISLLKYHSDLG
jgi:hypothetical protein